MTDKSRAVRRLAATATAISAAVLLAACSGHKREATQAAARVDGTEITVHQINYRLQRERGLRSDQMDAASRKVLEQLIDEQLLVEKAEKVKLDETPAAAQALDAARRDVLARAYIEQAAQSVPAPTSEALHAYFDANDALFTHRRIYTLQEYLAKVPEDKIPALKALVDGGKPVADIEAWFKAENAPFRGQQSTHPAEQIPLNSLKALAAVPDGHGLLASSGNQVHVSMVVSSTLQPVSYEQARPAIAQFLGAEARRKVTEANLAALKTSGKIDYSAPYQALAASGPALATTRDVESRPQITETGGTRVSLPSSASSGVQVTLPDATAVSGVQVALPSVTPGVRVSLPATAASTVEVRLPPQTATEPQK